MQYCSDCRSVEQGTITFYPEGYSEIEYIELGLKEADRLKVIDLSTDELIQWGKEKTSFEVCSQCEADAMMFVNEDYGQDR